ncbi:MAG TPA: hypothetical protein VM912_03525 [Terriglobales bacterium]|nr:hypothetical protein [Terriglobales bacterium]
MSIPARFLSSLLLSCFLISTIHAQQLDPKLYQGLRWRLVGPFRGGRTVSVAGIPGNPNVYYFGAVGGGVWKTSNGGITWNPIFDSQNIVSIGAIAVAPSDPNTIYVGTGEPDLRSDLSTGNGVYKSADAGATWQHIGLDDSLRLLASSLTRTMQIRWSSRRSATRTAQIRSGASSNPPMAEKRGTGRCSSMSTREPSISPPIRIIRAHFMRRCGTCSVHPGANTRQTTEMARSIARPTKAIPGRG